MFIIFQKMIISYDKDTSSFSCHNTSPTDGMQQTNNEMSDFQVMYSSRKQSANSKLLIAVQLMYLNTINDVRYSIKLKLQSVQKI